MNMRAKQFRLQSVL